MRSLGEIMLVNARAGLQEYEELYEQRRREGRGLTLAEANEAARALRNIQDLTGTDDEKEERRRRWERRKAVNRMEFFRRHR